MSTGRFAIIRRQITNLACRRSWNLPIIRPPRSREWLKLRVFGLVLCLPTLTFMSETSNHLKTLRLSDIAWNGGQRMTDQERQHLNECEDCRSELEIFIRQFAVPRSKERGNKSRRE